jgi:hypothetical protein
VALLGFHIDALGRLLLEAATAWIAGPLSETSTLPQRLRELGDPSAPPAISLTPRLGIGFGEVGAQQVRPNLFTALAVTPAVGRVFTERDAAAIVVLSHRFWEERLRSDPGVVGSAIRLGGQSYTRRAAPTTIEKSPRRDFFSPITCSNELSFQIVRVTVRDAQRALLHLT